MKCPNCKYNNDDENFFCQNCGTLLKNEAERIKNVELHESGNIYCIHCGRKTPANGNFCVKCGEGLFFIKKDAKFIHCPRCSLLNEKKVRFCHECGFPIEEWLFQKSAQYTEEMILLQEKEKESGKNKKNDESIDRFEVSTVSNKEINDSEFNRKFESIKPKKEPDFCVVDNMSDNLYFDNGIIGDRFKVEQKFISSKTGDVFICKDLIFSGKKVILKRIPVSLENLGDKNLVNLYTHFEELLNLNHRNIIKFLSIFRNEGELYIVSEYEPGKPLFEVLKDNDGFVSERSAFIVLKQIVDALSFAHKNNTPHLFLNPGNIIVKLDGTIKLYDFGIDRIVCAVCNIAPDEELPFFSYLSPEQKEKFSPDFISDIYSLGLVYYEMLTGIFSRTGTVMYLNRLSTISARIVKKCLNAGTDEGYGSIFELQKEVDGVKIETLNSKKTDILALGENSDADVFEPVLKTPVKTKRRKLNINSALNQKKDGKQNLKVKKFFKLFAGFNQKKKSRS